MTVGTAGVQTECSGKQGQVIWQKVEPGSTFIPVRRHLVKHCAGHWSHLQNPLCFFLLIAWLWCILTSLRIFNFITFPVSTWICGEYRPVAQSWSWWNLQLFLGMMGKISPCKIIRFISECFCTAVKQNHKCWTQRFFMVQGKRPTGHRAQWEAEDGN